MRKLDDSLFFQQIGVVRCLYVLSMVYQISSSMFVFVSLSLSLSLFFIGIFFFSFLDVCMNIVHSFFSIFRAMTGGFLSLQLYDNHQLFGFQNDFIIVLSLSCCLLEFRVRACV